MLCYIQARELWRALRVCVRLIVEEATTTSSPCPPQPRRARCLPPWAARAPGAAGPGALCPTGDAWANVANVIPGLGGQLTRPLPPPRPRPRRADRPPRAPGAARSERAGCTALCPTGGDATQPREAHHVYTKYILWWIACSASIPYYLTENIPIQFN